jgi:N-acylneuraminate cytidylyltransferase
MEEKFKKILAIIPARGGSKRIPRKNILPIGGKPLIGYSIDHAKQSKYINRIIVSTDDEEIAQVSKELGAEVPFLRPAELAGDTIVDFPVFEHALQWLKENENYQPDVVVQLRPTSPLRSVADIDAAIALLLTHPEADSVRTVLRAEPSPYKMYKMREDGLLAPLLTIPGVAESYNLPRQQLPPVYRHIGTADIIWPKTILEKKQMSGEVILGSVVEEAYTGIDTPENWAYYEFLIERQNKEAK